MLIESDQAIYRGDNYIWPSEIWSVEGHRWEPYKGSVPKEIGWGNVVTADEATGYMEPVSSSLLVSLSDDFPYQKP